MADDMVTDTSYEKVLTDNFKYVSEYWNSGNFKGYVASNSKKNFDKFIKDIGNVNSEYSAVKTPRVVSGSLPKPTKTGLKKPQSKRQSVSSPKNTSLKNNPQAGFFDIGAIFRGGKKTMRPS